MTEKDWLETWNSCEEDGEAEVRKKLAMGIYGPKKIETVREWLRQQESEQESARQRFLKTIAIVSAAVAAISALTAIVTMVSNIVQSDSINNATNCSISCP